MRIRPIQEKDRYEWLRLRGGLWPKEADLSGEVTRYFTGDLYSVAEVFVLDCGQGRLGGFIEVSLRNYAEGSVAPKVPYVEGWYVEKSRRGQGWGKQLMQAAEGWAKKRGLFELASDAEIGNMDSYRAHRSLGFKEVDRKVCFYKRLH